MNAAPVPALILRRTFAASPQRVYEAWTNPELAAQFLAPAGVKVSDVSMDVRVGGAFRLVMLHDDGDVYVANGIYRDVRPAERLSLTWAWEEDTPDEVHETLVTLDFAAHGSGTAFTLTHEKLRSEESRTRHEGGWGSMLERFDDLR